MLPLSNKYYIDALLHGYSWSGNVKTADTVSVSMAGLNSSQQTGVMQALKEWSDVANINFTYTSGTADIAVSMANLSSGIAGYTSYSYSGSTLRKASIVLDQDGSTISPGNFSFMAAIHEIGHALGLKHPGNYNGLSGSTKGPYLPTSEDTYDASIMSYNQGAHANYSHLPVGPMLYDIAAIQYLYGANTSHNSGNTLYKFTGYAKSETIWDGGGNDTFDVSSTSSTNIIDLREGLKNFSIVGNSNIWVAFGANIENATGGAGKDTIYGNGFNNNLRGNAGDDVLSGGTGNDILQGGSGNDTLTGGFGFDKFVINRGAGRDIIKDFSGAGAASGDTIYFDDSYFSSTASVLSAVHYNSSQGTATITLSSTESLTITGVSSGLVSSDFALF
jgi:serralysin